MLITVRVEVENVPFFPLIEMNWYIDHATSEGGKRASLAWDKVAFEFATIRTQKI